MSNYLVATLYSFVSLDALADLRNKIHQILTQNQIKGTLLLAHEGINGTIAGEPNALEQAMAALFALDELALDAKKVQYSNTNAMPFLRTKVKLKKEIVTMGVCGIEPSQHAGTYLMPNQWNELLEQPDVLLIDTRNDYEYQIGTFVGAINPNTQTFREFPVYVHEHIMPKITSNTKIAMFCTGGIRCEKSTSLLNFVGVERQRVFHLKGGILHYLQTIDEQQSKWQGACFVFDARVSVVHGLKQGSYQQCFACRYPISQADMQSSEYQKGVSCPRCIDTLGVRTKERVAERQKQITLAAMRGETHLARDLTQAKKAKQQAQAVRIAYAQAQQQQASQGVG